MNWIKSYFLFIAILWSGISFSQCNNLGNTSPNQGSTYNYSFQCGGCTNMQSGCLYLVGLQAGETIIVNGTTYNGPYTALTGNCTSGTNWITFSVTFVTAVSNISIGMETDGPHCGPAGQVDQIFNISASPCSAPPRPNVVSAPSTICVGGGPYTFSTSSFGATSYNWSYSGGGTPSGSGSSISFSPTSSGTLTVTATNSCGTSAPRNYVVTVLTTPATPGVISGTSPVCSSSSNTYSITAVSGATSYNWSYSGGGTPSGSGTSVTLSPTSNGTLSVTATNLCGTSVSSTLAVVVTPIEDASFSLSSVLECQNGTDITASIAGVSGGTFSSAAGLNINTITGAIDVSASSSSVYIVTYSTSGTCSGSSTQSVTISPQDNAGYTYPNTTFCQDESDPSATILGDVGGMFTSSTGLSLNAATGAIDLSASTPGNYSVMYTTPAPCVDTYSLPVTINSLSTVPLSITPSVTGTVCQGTNLNLVVAGGIAGTGANYVWYTGSCGGTFAGSTATLPITAAVTTTYYVRYEGICNNTACISYTLNVTPNTTISATGGNQAVCSNIATVTLAGNTATQGTGTWSQVSGPSTAGITTPNSPISGITGLNTAGNYVFEWTITNAPCIPTTSQMTVTVTTADNASYNYPSGTYCLTGTNPSPTITGMGGGTFTIDGVGVIDGTTGEINLSSSGIGNYMVTYTTNGTCPASVTSNIAITSSPTADFSYPNALYCEDNIGTGVAAVQFNLGSSGGTFTDQGMTGNLVIDGSTGEVDLALSDPGTYIVENNIVASGGCASANASASITITAQDAPSYSYTSSSFCEGDVNPIATVTGTAGGTFTSAPAGLTLNATTGEVDIATSTLDITYTITYTTAGTCPASEDEMVAINSAPSTPVVGTSIVGNIICVGQSIDITASGSGAGVTYNVYDALTGGTLLGTSDLTVSPAVTTDYFVEAVNLAGCAHLAAREVVTVTVNPLPSIDAGLDETMCPGDVIILTATGTGTYSWSTTETTGSISVSPAVSTTYTITLTDANTCVNSDDVLVIVQSISGTLNAVDDSYNVDQETLSTLNVISNDIFAGTLPNIITPPSNGIATVAVDGTITYTGNAGYVGVDILEYTICEVNCANICDTAQVSLMVDENVEISVPGGFSPNGDNIGDLFVIEGLDNFPNNNLQIFNRWGDLVYLATPYNNDWDGTSSESRVLIGGRVTTGTYFYVLDLGDETESLRGSIEIRKD